MNMRDVVIAALRRDPELVPRMTASLRQKIEGEEGRMATVVQAAEAIEPILEDAVRKRPSKLGKLGLKSAHILAGLAAEDEASTSKLAEIAQRSSVGIVFVDVSGFTSYTAENGDEAAIALLNVLTEVIQRSLKATKGELVKELGDGYLLAFPSASQAVRGAVSLRDATAERRRKDGSIPLMLRIAVHAGEPLIEQDDLLGHDVNLTARLLDHCSPGEIVVSAAAKELAEKRLKKIAFEGKREAKIRGLTTRVVIYNVNPMVGEVRRAAG